MKTANLSFVPLQHASLCLDCETITTAHTNCQACGSQALLNLARVLNTHSPILASSVRGPVPLSYPRGRRHAFYSAEPNFDRHFERLEAAPMRFAVDTARSRHETFES